MWQPSLTNLTLNPVRDPVTGHVTAFKEEAENSKQAMEVTMLATPRRAGALDELEEAGSSQVPAEPIISDKLLTRPPGLDGLPYLGPNAPSVRFRDLPTLSDEDSPLNLINRLTFRLPDPAPTNQAEEEAPEEGEEEEEDEKEDEAGWRAMARPKSKVKPKEAKSGMPRAKSWCVMVDLQNTPVANFEIQVSNPVRTWPFELDTFQKQAVIYLEQHKNVFVAAHTSAGKTVVAEYAIAMTMLTKKRTIYTSPIKALSNQKYRDFKEQFEDVGLITGDVQINPSGSCLIMTTEILRSMLYNQSTVISELDWVIFDECHYINDAERGVVWEEVLILLPEKISIILLSATVPNAREFAEWVGRTRKRRIHVISTSHRPVPLEHFLFTGNSNRTTDFLFRVVDQHRVFSEAGYRRAVESTRSGGGDAGTVGPNAAMAAAAAAERGRGADRGGRGGGGRGGRGGGRGSQKHTAFRYQPPGSGSGGDAAEKTYWLAVLQMLRAQERLPAVIFVFSRARIEKLVGLLRSADLLTKAEQHEVRGRVQAFVKRLRPEDRRIPQVVALSELLMRGIGIHHSGVLPFLREVVELLFQAGRVKALFATETFAMGVNMPTRTVLFDAVTKHDGRGRRALLPGEYTQMAGRAGRRGLDPVGIVMVLCKRGEVPGIGELQRMMLGKPTPLESRFRLTYSMILALMRSADTQRVFDMMKRSFGEYGDQVGQERRLFRRQELTQQLNSWPRLMCSSCSRDLDTYAALGHEAEQRREALWAGAKEELQLVLDPGRLVLTARGPGLILKRTGRQLVLLGLSPAPEAVPSGHSKNLLAARLLPAASFNAAAGAEPARWEAEAASVTGVLEATVRVTPSAAAVIEEDLAKRRRSRFRDDPLEADTKRAVADLKTALGGSLDWWLPPGDLSERVKQLERDLGGQFHCLDCPLLAKHLEIALEKAALTAELAQLQEDRYGTLGRLQLLPEFQQRLDVLRRLGFIDAAGKVELKGRTACAISSHELVITELVFQGHLEELEPPEVAALFASFVFELRRHNEEEQVTPPDAGPAHRLAMAEQAALEVARKIGEVQKDCGMPEAPEDFVARTLSFGLGPVVLAWARGRSFADVAAMAGSTAQEGVIVRCVVRLDELLRNLADAAHVLGNRGLKEKVEKASSLIKRDIIFAASLYTSDP